VDGGANMCVHVWVRVPKLAQSMVEVGVCGWGCGYVSACVSKCGCRCGCGLGCWCSYPVLLMC